MNHFQYRDGVLHAEDVPVPDIARAVAAAASPARENVVMFA